MGTRADFYVGRGPEAEWLGSTAWDGYPDGFGVNPSDEIRQAVRDVEFVYEVITENQKGLFEQFMSVSMCTVPLESALKKLRKMVPPKEETTYPIFTATTEDEYRKAIAEHVATREDFTKPEDGWPWPWEDSRTTDYAYAFFDGKVHASCFGHEWFDPLVGEDDERENPSKMNDQFPDMKARQNVQRNSTKGGAIFIGVDTEGRVTID